MGGVRVALQTHGCRLNQAEGDSMAKLLTLAGHAVVDDVAGADILVLNSCAITHQADADARRAVRRARRANPQLRVAVTGCWVEADPAAAAAGVDVVFGNRAKARVADLLLAPDVPLRALKGRRRPVELPPAMPRHRTRALLKVQDGCDYRCSFCIVPFVRGASRSVPLDTLQRQAAELAAAGAPEIVISGIHLGTYGRDLTPRRTLASLIDALLLATGSARLRLSAVDPHEVDDELVSMLQKRSDRLCRHLHLPVQSLDDGVLGRMRRAHTASSFSHAVGRLVTAVPGIAIGTDVIVGFPAETDAAFQTTKDRLVDLPLAYLHVFPYSVRRGTSAADMPDQIAAPVRAERQRILSAVSNRHRAAFRLAQIGTEAPAIVYRRPDPKTGRLRVLTDNYLELSVTGSPDLCGRAVRVRVGPGGNTGQVLS